MTGSRRIRIPVLARVEGEGALSLTIQGGDITGLELRIFEPPRFFEKFLEGRHFAEVPDIVARICGICPVAYQMTAVQAFEGLFDVDPGPWVRAMRRLFYCGEWIQSHSLHVHMLALPDFLGFSDVASMASKYPAEVRRGLRLQALGNDLIALLGGRSVHPVGALVGGFSRAPEVAEVRQLQRRVESAEEDALDLFDWVLSLEMPAGGHEGPMASLRDESRYPVGGGGLYVDDGTEVALGDFPAYFRESHVPWSTALHAHYHAGAGEVTGVPYLVGPLARLNNNHAVLPHDIRAGLERAGVRLPSRNTFHSLLARTIEIVVALREAAALLSGYEMPARPKVDATPRAGVAHGCTEAPRGILWHRYEVDEEGLIRNARIVPPTSQNQAHMEASIRTALLDFGLDRPDEALRLHAEKVIRNYDPCISCATHFLRLDVERDGGN